MSTASVQSDQSKVTTPDIPTNHIVDEDKTPTDHVTGNQSKVNNHTGKVDDEEAQQKQVQKPTKLNLSK